MLSSTLCFQCFSYNPITSSLNSETHKNTFNNAQNPSNSQQNALIKAPTAPWMKGPLFLQPHDLLHTSKPRKDKPLKKAEIDKTDKALTAKEVRGKKAMANIVKSIEKLQKNQSLDNSQLNYGSFENVHVVKKLQPWVKEDKTQFNFEVLETTQVVKKLQPWVKDEKTQLNFERIEVNSDEELRVKEDKKQLNLKSFERNEVNFDEEFSLSREKLKPWDKEEKLVYWRMKKEKVVTKAELCLDKELLERLRNEASKMKIWIKVMKLGVTQNVVDQIKLTWKTNELAMLKFDRPLNRNMTRAQELVEMKTGGLVVWTKKDTLVVYRGQNNLSDKSSTTSTMNEEICRKDGEDEYISTSIFLDDAGTSNINRSLFERETDRLLDGLGPRFVDWWMRKPLPVDGDLLPEVVPGFMTPPRFQYGRAKLRDDELTYWRKLAPAFPTHFVLGRNRRLQGLAAAIIKLWEKSPIAKIAVKWGIPNTDNEQMANELKLLTGGVLLLRNKFFIILFRGKDFLPNQVANMVEDRENELKRCQLNEEDARLKSTELFYMEDDPAVKTSKIGTLHEFHDIQVKFEDFTRGYRDSKLQIEAEKEKLEKELRIHESRLLVLQRKIEKATRQLSKLNSSWKPAEQNDDLELMTEEEKECLKKIGLKLQGSLVLGRRGVFDGVIEGLHQHWKHREVVKVITMQKMFEQVVRTAKFLQEESGGILVSIEKLKKGHAIIIYRGKNYRRPLKLGDNLLTKRAALQRSLEIQRIGSLRFFANQRQHAIRELRLQLAQLQDSEERIRGTH